MNSRILGRILFKKLLVPDAVVVRTADRGEFSLWDPKVKD